jgi:Fic-DOC domain mobile mystery protein B
MPRKFTGYVTGQTPLDPNEINGLIPDHITLLNDLNELEQANITKAIRQYLMGRTKNWDLTDPLLLRKIHADMFSEVWEWAGRFRKTDKNIGVAREQIASEVKKACDDLQFWEKEKTFSIEEIAVRYHHRLVLIHPFPNGNGRFSRLVADIFLRKHGHASLNWGSNLSSEDESRKMYLQALKLADKNDFSKLLKIAQSKSK